MKKTNEELRESLDSFIENHRSYIHSSKKINLFDIRLKLRRKRPATKEVVSFVERVVEADKQFSADPILVALNTEELILTEKIDRAYESYISIVSSLLDKKTEIYEKRKEMIALYLLVNGAKLD